MKRGAPVRFDDEYHKVLRDYQKQRYEEKGRIEKSIKGYMKRYNLKPSFLKDCQTNDEKLDKLRKKAEEIKRFKAMY